MDEIEMPNSWSILFDCQYVATRRLSPDKNTFTSIGSEMLATIADNSWSSLNGAGHVALFFVFAKVPVSCDSETFKVSALNKNTLKTLIKPPYWRKTTRNCRVMGSV